jgi:hypothetical protein
MIDSRHFLGAHASETGYEKGLKVALEVVFCNLSSIRLLNVPYSSSESQYE